MVRQSARIPTHPGELLREEILPALELSVPEFAAHLSLPEADLLDVLAERSGVTPDLALRLGAFIGNGAAFWNRLQAAHDELSHQLPVAHRNASPG